MTYLHSALLFFSLSLTTCILPTLNSPPIRLSHTHTLIPPLLPFWCSCRCRMYRVELGPQSKRRLSEHDASIPHRWVSEEEREWGRMRVSKWMCLYHSSMSEKEREWLSMCFIVQEAVWVTCRFVTKSLEWTGVMGLACSFTCLVLLRNLLTSFFSRLILSVRRSLLRSFHSLPSRFTYWHILQLSRHPLGGIMRNVLSPVLSGGCVITCSGFDPLLFWYVRTKWSEGRCDESVVYV